MRSAVIALCVLWATSAQAEGPDPLSVGDTLPAFSLEDQHGRTHALGAEIRVLLFTRDMDAGGLVREALKSEGSAQLAAARAVYVSDIHRMPALITRMVALPRMRRLPYPILLDRGGETTLRWPTEAGQPTLMRLEQRRITQLRSLGSIEELRAALKPAAEPAP